MTLADEVAFWSADHYLKGFLLLSGVPIILFFVNTLGVKVCHWLLLGISSLEFSRIAPSVGSDFSSRFMHGLSSLAVARSCCSSL
jgi:hypothetical protein